MKKLLSISAFCFLLSALPARAAAPTPFIAWTTDLVGENRTNTVTIEAWTQTNTITGVSTNLVLNFSKTYYPTNPAGFFSGVLQPGNYRLTVEGLSRGIVFGMPSSSSTQNLAQLAGVPVYAFMNFTLAQFSDAGSAAYHPSNTWLRIADIPSSSAAYQPSNAFVGLTTEQTITGNKVWSGSNAFLGAFVVTNARAKIVMGDAESQKTLVISNYFDTELTLKATGAGAGTDSPGQRLLTVSAAGDVGTPSWGDDVLINAPGLTNLQSTNLIGYIPEANLSNNFPRFNADGGLTLSGASAISHLSAIGTNSIQEFAIPLAAYTTLAAGNNKLTLGTNSFYELSGNLDAANICSIDTLPNRDGAMRTFLYRGPFTLTITNESGFDSTAANRIRVPNGTGVSSAGPCMFTVRYIPGLNRWWLENIYSIDSGISRSDATNVVLALAAVPANLATPALTMTNFVEAYFYTNGSGRTIHVQADAWLTPAAVSGRAALELQIGNGAAMNRITGFAEQTTASSIANNYTNAVAAFITNGGVYCFTNNSSGAGNAAGLVGGTGHLTSF